MSEYFFVQSQDPFTEVRATNQYQLMQQLQAAGNAVSVLLVQNGVTPARASALSPAFDELRASGVNIVVDDFSLQQREIESDGLKSDVSLGSVDLVIDAMLAGQKVIWN